MERSCAHGGRASIDLIPRHKWHFSRGLSCLKFEDCTIFEPKEPACLPWPSPLDILLTQLEYKALGHTVVNIQKGTIQRNWGLGAPQTLRRLRRTQGPFNGKLMGMFGIKGETEGGGGGGGSLVAWELGIEKQRRRSWWRFTTDAERFGMRGGCG